MVSPVVNVLVPLLLVLSICGCEVPVFTHPLVEPTEAVVPAELLGSWRVVSEPADPQIAELAELADDDDQSFHYADFQHIGLAGDKFPPGFVRVVSVSVPDGAENKILNSSFVGFACRMGQWYVLHIPLPKDRDELTARGELSPYEQDWDPEKFEGYLFVLLKPTKTGLEQWDFDTEFLAGEIEAGRLAGEYGSVVQSDNDGSPLKEDSVEPKFLVTADAKSLKEFLKVNLNNKLLKSPAVVYRRIE